MMNKALPPSTRYLLGVMRASILMGWATTAIATGITLSTPAPYVIDPLVAMLACVVSTLSAVSALAWRVNDLLVKTPERPLVKPWLFAIAHITGSWMGGMFAFFSARVNNSSPDATLMFVLIMSFAGAKGLEVIAEKWMPVIRPPSAGGAEHEE